jgi:hypothetical protein
MEPEKDFGYMQDQNIMEKLRLDPRYRGVEETLLAEVAGVSWSLSNHSGNNSHVKYYEWMLNQINGFSESRINMARAVVEGMACLRIEGMFQYTTIPGDTERRRWWIPKKLRFIPPGRIRRSLHYDKNRKPWWRWNIFDPYINRWLPITDETKYIWSSYRATEENIGYGNGLAQSIYNMMKLKVVLLELLSAGAERWVDSWIIVKLTDTMKQTSDLYKDGAIQDLLKNITQMRAHGVLAVQDADIELSPPGQSNTGQILLDMVEKIDREITILMTATNLPTDIQSGGSYAATQGQLEQQSKRLLFQRNSVVAEPLTDWLLYAIYKNNLPNWRNLGIAGHSIPYLTISGGEVFNANERLQAFQFAIQNGIPIAEDDLRSQLKLSEISEGKKVVKVSPQVQGGFSEETEAIETDLLKFKNELNQNLKVSDRKENSTQAIEEAVSSLGDTLIKMAFGQATSEDIEKKQAELTDSLRKTMLYHDLSGRESVIKDIEKQVGKEVENESK